MFKLERKTNKVDDYEQSSEILLDMADKTFNYHYDMSKRIENKSNMIIVIIGILFTISSGNLIKDVINNNLEMKNICIVLFLLNVIFYFIAIYFFIQVLKLQDYYLLREDIFKESNLPDGCMINWSNNGRGVDLNSNIESSHFIDRVVNGEKIYGKFHLNNIRRDKLGPTGCPFYKFGEIEKENIALLNFYDEIKNNYDLIGSFIYHSCGNIVYYLGEDKEKNPWVDLTEKMKSDNKKCALAYAYRSKYKIDGLDIYTTMDAKIKSLFPVTLLIELGGVRATPLSQFMDLDLDGSDDSFKHVYSKIINDNVQAVLATIEEMLDIYRGK